MPEYTDSLHAVFLDLATVDRNDLDLTPLHETVESFDAWPVTSPEDLAERTQGKNVLVINKTPLDAAALEAARPALVCLAATGTDNVDLEAARRLGVAVANIRDYCTDSVVQHVFALVLALTVRLIDYRRSVRAGAWSRSSTFAVLDWPVRELAGKTFAVIGHGTLGRAAAERARAFGMQVQVAEHQGDSPRAGRVAFEQALEEADVLSLHAPLTPQTRGLIDAGALRRMRSEALLINTARGALVDEVALAEALRAGEIGGAGLDVLSREPPELGNPLLNPDVPNCLVTPHIAWAAREARQRAIGEIAANINAWAAGERRNRVD